MPPDVSLHIQKPDHLYQQQSAWLVSTCLLYTSPFYYSIRILKTGIIRSDNTKICNIFCNISHYQMCIRDRVSIEKGRNGKTLLVITELPYEIRESAMLRKIESLRTTRKELFAGISDVRSETDRSGIRAVIELKSGVNAEKVLDCLYKYSDLQISYGINMVAIADGQPKLLNLLQLLDYYIAHQKAVVTNRLTYDKEAAEEKAHKLEGLILSLIHISKIRNVLWNPL